MKILIPALALFSASAWAHGNLPSQATSAVTASMQLLQDSVERAALRGFKSVTAELVAHETFQVTSAFADGTTVRHLCQEDESVEPIVWRCEAR